MQAGRSADRPVNCLNEQRHDALSCYCQRMQVYGKPAPETAIDSESFLPPAPKDAADEETASWCGRLAPWHPGYCPVPISELTKKQQYIIQSQGLSSLLLRPLDPMLLQHLFSSFVFLFALPLAHHHAVQARSNAHAEGRKEAAVGEVRLGKRQHLKTPLARSLGRWRLTGMRR